MAALLTWARLPVLLLASWELNSEMNLASEPTMSLPPAAAMLAAALAVSPCSTGKAQKSATAQRCETGPGLPRFRQPAAARYGGARQGSRAGASEFRVMLCAGQHAGPELQRGSIGRRGLHSLKPLAGAQRRLKMTEQEFRSLQADPRHLCSTSGELLSTVSGFGRHAVPARVALRFRYSTSRGSPKTCQAKGGRRHGQPRAGGGVSQAKQG